MAEKTVEICVRGRVQGVGFRAWAAREARALGLGGWVRNEPDGSVTVLVAGSGGAVDAMVARLRQGPPAAIVENLRVSPAETAAPPDGFDIRR